MSATRGAYHAFPSEKLSSVHIHHADIGSRHVTRGRGALVVAGVERSKNGEWEICAPEADAARLLLVTTVGHDKGSATRCNRILLNVGTDFKNNSAQDATIAVNIVMGVEGGRVT